MKREHPDHLSSQLTGLPPVKAGPQFTREVLERLDRTPRSVRWAPQLAVAALTLTAVVTLWSTVGPRWRSREPVASPPDRTESASRSAPLSQDELTEEYRQIEAELTELRRLAEESAPILYLTSTPDYDVVFDLRTLMASEPARYEPASEPRGEVRPARRDG